ncbi:MAG: cadherin-like beta sandwich domain-containing protein [Clostridia bacterium]|nr:cadherin-like beta sandwich domain-containing protein [Clostridia bacterium]
MSVSTGSLKIKKGGSASFTVKASNAAGKISISSSDTGVATASESSVWLDNSSVTVTVKGVANGSCRITVKCVDVATYDEETVSSSYTVKITVYTPETTSEKPHSSEPTSEKPRSSEPKKPAPEKKSGNADLKALSPVGFEMTEAFSPDVTSYTAYAPEGIEKAEFSFETDSAKAKAALSGEALEEGWNDVKILVTAENGDTKTYVVRVYRPETPTEFYSFRGRELGKVKNVDLVSLEGFAPDEELVFRPEEGEGPAVLYLVEPESGNTDFYLFDEKEDAVVAPFRVIRAGDSLRYPADASEEEPPADPSLLSLESADWEETGFAVWRWRDPAMKDFSIWVLRDGEGNAGFYRLDETEKTWQRYVPEPVPEPPAPEEEPAEETGTEENAGDRASETAGELPPPETGRETPENDEAKTDPRLIWALGAAGGGILLAVIFFALWIRSENKRRKSEKSPAEKA